MRLSAQEIRAIFTFFDEDNSGSVSVDELGRAVQQLGLNPSQASLPNNALPQASTWS